MTPTAPTQPPKNLLGATYEFMKKGDFDVPDSYDEFEQMAVDDPAYLNDLHTLFKEEKWTAADNVDEFRAQMLDGVKKKPSQDMASGFGLGASAGSVPGLASGVLGTGSPDQEFAQPSVLEDVPRISPRSAVQQAPGDNYIAAGINPTMEQLRADEAAKQPQPEAADVADDGFWASFGKSLYNGLDLKRIGGNLLDYGGDLVESLANNTMYDDYGNRLHEVSDLGKPITDSKTSDVMARDLLGRAQASDLPISQAAQQSILSNPSLASAGNLLGSGAASIVPVAAASMMGGPVAGAGVGAGLGISATKDAARQAGIGDEEAMVTATILAPIQGVLESLGVKDPGIAKLAVRATLREALVAGEGKLTREGLAFASKKILPEVAKRFAAGAKHEGLTEFLQGEAEGASKLIADKVRGNEDAAAGQGRYGVSAFDALVKSPIEQTIAGIALGGGIGTTHGGGTQIASQEAIEAPLQASEAPVDERTFSVRRPTGQVEMENVRVHAVSADGKTAVVRGVDAQGSPIEREVPTDSLREDANKNNASPPSPLPQGEGVTSPDAPYQPTPDTRTVSIGEAGDGTPMYADVTADGKAVAVHNGSEQFSDLTPFADVLAHDFTDVPTAEQPTTASADPSIIDVTDQAPEPIAPEPTPAPEGGTQDVAPAEPSPTEPPAPVPSPPDANTGAVPASVDRTAEREAAQAAVDEYNDGDTATRKGLTGVQQRQAIQELADKAGMSVSLDEKSKATLTDKSPVAPSASAAEQPQTTTLPVSGSPRYHGTSAKFELGSSNDLDHSRNLFGKGFYTTDNRAVADGYTKKGKGAAPAVYSVEWSGDKPARLVNLDQPLPPEVFKAMQATAPEAELDPAAPGTKVYEQLKQHLADEGFTASEVNEVYDAISHSMGELGYDGVQHQGGNRYQKGSPDHDVQIYFHPVNELTGKPNIKLTELGPDATEQPASTPSLAEQNQQAKSDFASALDRFRAAKSQRPFLNLLESKSLDETAFLRAARAAFGKSKTLAETKEAYRALAREHHPDKGGSPRAMQIVNDLYERAKRGESFDSPASQRAATRTPQEWEQWWDAYEKRADEDSAKEAEYEADKSFYRNKGEVGDVLFWLKHQSAREDGRGYQARVVNKARSHFERVKAWATANNQPQWLSRANDGLELLSVINTNGIAKALDFFVNVKNYGKDPDLLRALGSQPAGHASLPIGDFDNTVHINHNPAAFADPTDVFETVTHELIHLYTGYALHQQESLLTPVERTFRATVFSLFKRLHAVGVKSFPEAFANKAEFVSHIANDARLRAWLRANRVATGASPIKLSAWQQFANALAGLFGKKPYATKATTYTDTYSALTSAFTDYLRQTDTVKKGIDISRFSSDEDFWSKSDGVVPRASPPAAPQYFSEEEDSAIKDMVKAAIKLGAVKTKQVIAHLRSNGLTEDEATDNQLLPLTKDALKEAGVFKAKQPSPQNSPQGEGSRDRAHAKRYDANTQANLTADEKTYVPAKEQISASEKPADYIKRVGEDAAYERALGDPAYTGTNDDAADLLHDNLIRGVAEHFTAVRDAALKNGNTALADDAQQKLLRLAGKLSQTGTRQAKALQARVGAGGTIEALVDAANPAETGKATVDQAYGQIANQNAEHDANNEKDGRKIAKAAVPKRKAKMAAVLETPAVKAAIEKAATAADGPAAPDAKGYGETNKVFTKKGLADLRARLKGMAFAAPLPPDLIYLGGYHLEASTRQFADWSKKMVREVGARVKPRLAELYAASQAELLKKDPKATGFNTPQEVAALVAERDAPGAVAKGIRKMGKTIAKIAKQHAADIETDRRTLTDKFIQDAGLSGVDAKEMADAIEKEWTKRKEKGAWQAIGRRFQPKRSRARLDALDRLVNDLNAAANLPETTMRSPVAQILEQLLDNKVQISAAEAQEIERLKDAYVKAAAKTSQTIGGQAVEARNTRAVTEASLNLLQAIGKLKNVGKNDWGRDAGAMFYASLLSNPLTHAANFYLTAGATAREVGVISSIHTAAETTKIIDLLNPILSLFRGEVPKLPLAFQPAKALFPGYKRGLGDAHYVFTTGIDVKTKTGATLSDGSYETDPLEEKSYARRLLSKITGKPAPEKSSLRFVRRSLGASDTFMQAGLNEARYKEIAIKQATKEVARRQASGQPMSGKEVRQFVDDEVDRLMFNTPEALADIKAITDNEGLGNPKTVDERAALLSRTGDLLDQARAAQNPDAAADSKEFAARHAGNSNYEGHLGRFAEFLAKSFKGIPAVGSLVVPFAKVTSNFQNRYAEWNGLGFYRAVQGGAGKSPLAFLGSKVGEVESRYQRDYTPEEREKAFLRSTIGLLTHITAYAALKAGYIALTGLPTGNKDEDQQAPPKSIVFLKGPPWLIGKSITYKGMNEESGFTMLAGLDRYIKQKGLAGDSPEVVDKLAMSGILLGAATMNAGPSNGAGDFLGAISKAEISPSGLANLSKRLGTTAVKAAVMPAGLQFALTLYSQSTDANLPEKRSNDAWQQLTMDVFGDIPSWRGGAEDAVDTFGDPMKVATTKFWGFAPVGNDPEKYAVKRRLVDLRLVPNAPRITDPALRIFDVKTRQKATQMTPAEFKEFCQVRGQTLWKEISHVNRRGKTPVLTAIKTGTPEEAAREMEYAVETARQAAKDHILAQRVKKGQDVQFGRPKAE